MLHVEKQTYYWLFDLAQFAASTVHDQILYVPFLYVLALQSIQTVAV